jgi:putative ATPase
MDLFDDPGLQTDGPDTSESLSKRPLAYRMSPRSLDEYLGQGHIIGPGKLLRRAIEAGRISSIILYGPPGTGKTALARIIARNTKAGFVWLNAATIGLDELRKVLKQARRDIKRGRNTLLFLDEIHRFNKLQQDALLPDVEEGTLTLIAATIENPFFYVNQALLSRSQIFELKSLEEDDIKALLNRALIDKDRGLGATGAELSPEALEHIALKAGGDARKALSALELAVLSTPPDKDGKAGLSSLG